MHPDKEPTAFNASASGRQRPRAKKACRECNLRRVRCDVMECQPCHHCQSAGVSCELMNSRRGKYERLLNRSQQASRTPTVPAAAPNPASNSPLNVQPPNQTCSVQNTETTKTGLSEQQYAAPQEKDDARDMLTPESTTHGPSRTQEVERTVFLGDSNLLTWMTCEGEQSSLSSSSPEIHNEGLCYSISDAISSRAADVLSGSAGIARKIDHLTSEGAFTAPAPNVCKTLFRAYFQWFHPCFPILDRAEICSSYMSSTLSPLLLQSMLFIGASQCSDTELLSVGIKDRHRARSVFYNRAKDIYDADWEVNQTIVLQSLFLLSFWRAGPLNEKDTRHWMGAAISFAQTRGLHRSCTRVPNADINQVRIRRRIWWSLYVRDRQCSASLGLPMRIRDEDCDVEPLTEADFLEEGTPTLQNIFGSATVEHTSYAIQTANLARLLGKIYLSEFSPGGSPLDSMQRSKLKTELLQWETSLPAEMRLNTAMGDQPTIWTGMLHMAYNHLHVLLHRSVYLSGSCEAAQGDGAVALQAACRTTRIVEDMLALDLVQHGQMQIITCLFSALCIHTITIRRSSKIAKKLAEHRAQTCLLGLKELQKSWDVCDWVLQLFFQFLDESTARRLQVSDYQITASATETTRAAAGENLLAVSNRSEVFAPLQSGGDQVDTDSMEFFFDSKMADDISLYPLQSDQFSMGGPDGSLYQYFGSSMPQMDLLDVGDVNFLTRIL